MLKGSTSKARSGVLVVPYSAVAREMICDLSAVKGIEDILHRETGLGLGLG